jgi:hypothetical protein
MQLFVLDKSSTVAAKMLWEVDPLRANKQLLECCQCIAACGITLPKSNNNGVYAITHKNHPIVRWMRENPEHLAWAIEFAEQLSRIYTTRTGKVHGCDIAVQAAKNHAQHNENRTIQHIYVSNIEFSECTSVYGKYANLLAHKKQNSKR